MSDGLDHLLPETRASAALPNTERLAAAHAAQWWIGYAQAEAVLRRFDHLLTYGPGRTRPPTALLVSPANNGKSMVVDRFRRNRTPREEKVDEAETLPVAVVQMPAEPTVTRFCTALLGECGAPSARGRASVRKHDVEQLAPKVLHVVKVRVLVIDELHNMLSGSSSARREFLNLLRDLGNTLRIPLIGAATQEAYLAIRTDFQLENRFEPVGLPPWLPGTETATFLASYAASLPLRHPSPDLLRGNLVRTILARSGGTIGEMLTLMRSAVVATIECGEEAINERTLKLAPYRGQPSAGPPLNGSL